MEIISIQDLMGIPLTTEELEVQEANKLESPELPELPDCLVALLNFHLEEMVSEGNNSAQIVTLREGLQKQVFEQRNAIKLHMEAQGYTVITNMGDENIKHMTGWRLHERLDGTVPEKLMTEGAPLHYRGDISYKNFKLYIQI